VKRRRFDGTGIPFSNEHLGRDPAFLTAIRRAYRGDPLDQQERVASSQEPLVLILPYCRLALIAPFSILVPLRSFPPLILVRPTSMVGVLLSVSEWVRSLRFLLYC